MEFNYNPRTPEDTINALQDNALTMHTLMAEAAQARLQGTDDIPLDIATELEQRSFEQRLLCVRAGIIDSILDPLPLEQPSVPEIPLVPEDNIFILASQQRVWQSVTFAEDPICVIGLN